MSHIAARILLGGLTLAWNQFATASENDKNTLETVVVTGHYENAVGTSDAASQGQVHSELLKSRPAQRTGEVLEFVPGVIVTQHSGDGKANQYFLRGFNLDHGTDFATSVDGMPVNQPTHGHGQGYSDLNFLIPELVHRIDYRKGPYFAEDGDFSLAGSADILYRRSLKPFAQLTLGQRGYQRAVLGGSTPLEDGRTLLAGIELMRHDGPWTVPQDLQKTNAVFKWSGGTLAEGWSASLMGYGSTWNATDQVPHRAIESGQIGRFDSLDPTDGGEASRLSVAGEWHRRESDGGMRLSGYLIRSRLNLFSNFTYAMERPLEGDQFEQNDVRTTWGLHAARDWDHSLFGLNARTKLGVQMRRDDIDVGLYDAMMGSRGAAVREDAVRETSLGVYAESTLEWSPWLRTIAGVRADRFAFDVTSSLDANSGRRHDSQISPKLSTIFGPWAQTEFFVNAGRGFHSNDARGTTTRIDPKTGLPTAPVPGLVAGQGHEFGVRTEVLPGLQSSLALWRLRNDSELVYVGDAGTTEASRPSKRSGVEWNNHWTPYPWLLLDADFAWTRARFSDADPAGDRIPGAVDRTAAVAATLKNVGPWSASLQWRYLGPRALTEDGSVRSQSTLLTNLRVSRKLGRNLELTLDVFNLLDRKANDIEYFYESRLPGEAAAQTADRHLHPVEPRALRLTLWAGF